MDKDALLTAVSGYKPRSGGRCLSAAQFGRLAVYAGLISQGLREAYLVDGMSLDAPGAAQALRDISPRMELSVVQLGEDNLVLILTSVLLDKIAALKEHGASSSFPLYVSVDQSPALPPHAPRLLGEEEMQRIWGCLYAATTTMNKVLRDPSSRAQRVHGFDDLDYVERVAGLSFVAGWLLGYPCVYHSIASDGLGGTLLSMQVLRKYSITATLASDIGRLRGSKGPIVDLSEFSVPLCILEPLSLDKALSELLAERVRTLECRIQELGRPCCLLEMGAVRVESQDFELPHVMI